MPDPSLAPDRFLLTMLKDRCVFNCRLAWTQHDRIGVTFEPEIRKSKIEMPEGITRMILA